MPTAASVSFFDRLDVEAREALLSVARQVSFVKGARMVRHGEHARGAWILREGAAEASVMLPGGEPLTVGRFGSGSVFGEMALLNHGTCTATVTATSNLDGWFVERDDFRALVAQRSAVALRIQRTITLVLAEKLRELNAQVLACESPEDRPARAEDPSIDPIADAVRSRQTNFSWRDYLPRLPLFEGLDELEIDEVVAEGRLVDLARDAAVFVAGGKAEAAFVVVRGAVEVAARRGRLQRRIAVLGPGQLFGFMSLLEERPHGVSAYARETLLLLELPRPGFESLYMGNGSVAAKLHRAVQSSLLTSLGQTNRQLTRLISLGRLADTAGRREFASDSGVLSAAYHGQIVTGLFAS